MEGFSRIKDPMRLKKGDILYFPPRESEPRLAVGLSTLAKMGISMGNTRRASNSMSRVKKMFVEHPGPHGFALMVGETWSARTWTDGERKFINFIGNNGSAGSETVPRVRQVSLHAIPVPGEDPDNYEWRCMWKALGGRACKYVCGLGIRWDLFANDSWGDNGDKYLRCVFEESPDRSGREHLPEVPHTCRDEEPTNLADDNYVVDILYDWYGSNSVNLKDTDNHAFVLVTGKFASECVKRGAVLVRPNERILDMMARQLVPAAMAGWAEHWSHRLQFVAQFVANLNRETERAIKRPKAYAGYARKAALKAVERKRLLKESRKAFGYEHQLQLDGDRGDAGSAPAER